MARVITITINKEQRAKQRYSFSSDRPGPQPKRKDPKRYSTPQNARRAARAMFGAQWNDDGYYEAPIGNAWYKLVFVTAWK